MKYLILFCISIASFRSFSKENMPYDATFRTSLSILEGESNEIVYRNDTDKLSELIWGLEGVSLLGVGVSIEPVSNIKVNLDLYRNYIDGESTMDDYDWLDYTISDWTHWSNSPTYITEVLKYDLNTQFDWDITENYSIFVILGYRYDSYKWAGHGGDYVYSSDTGFRDLTGSFSDVSVISYNQYFNTPYIGLGSNLNFETFTLEGKITYSNNGIAKDEDTHHLRNLYFEDFFEEVKFMAINIKGKYDITSNIALIASYEYEEYFLTKGYIKETDLSTNQVTTYGDGTAGIEHYSSMITFGAQFNF